MESLSKDSESIINPTSERKINSGLFDGEDSNKQQRYKQYNEEFE